MIQSIAWLKKQRGSHKNLPAMHNPRLTWENMPHTNNGPAISRLTSSHLRFLHLNNSKTTKVSFTKLLRRGTSNALGNKIYFYVVNIIVAMRTRITYLIKSVFLEPSFTRSSSTEGSSCCCSW